MKVTVSNKLRVEGMPVELEKAVRSELTLANPEYVSRRRMGRWVPKGLKKSLSLVEVDKKRKSLILPRGYMDRLMSMAHEAGLEVSIDDQRVKLATTGLSFTGTLRPYQARAVRQMAKYGSGILEAPCGSGKTAMAMALVARWQQPALLIAHTKDLVSQLAQAARTWLGVEPGYVGDGTWDFNPVVTVAIVHTLAARPDDTRKMAQSIGLVILDEAHHAPAETFIDVIGQFPAGIRYGLTATPDRKDGLGPFMTAALGPVRAVVTPTDLQEAGLLVRPRLEWVPTGFRYPYESEEDYQALISALAADEDRNQTIVSLVEDAIGRGLQALVLTDRVDHAKRLSMMLCDRIPEASEAITGDLSKSERSSILTRLREGVLKAVFATRLADEGLDVPELSTVVLASPSRDGNRTRQRIGRIMRPCPGKKGPVVYDIVDLHVPILASQARSRFFDCYRELVDNPSLPDWLRKS